jgi:MIP family channel proteins
MSRILFRNLAAEALGTAFVVLFSAGAAVVNQQTGALGLGGCAAACGLVVLGIIQALGPVSGAHVNPAVTLAFWAGGRFRGGWVGPYIAAQLAGALAGAGLLRGLFPGSLTLGATLPAHGALQAVTVETGLTFWLVLVILRVVHGAREQGLLAGLTISATVALCVVVGGPLSGGSMNPARSLGPALVSGQLAHAWVYLVGPLAGALLAVAADRLFRAAPNANPDSAQ